MNLAALIDLARRVWTIVSSVLKKREGPIAVSSGPAFYFDRAQMARIREFRKYYAYAATVVGGMKWEALVPIHFREASLGYKVKRLGGIYQLEHGVPADQTAEAIRKHVTEVCNRYGIAYADIESNYHLASVVAADELKSKAHGAMLVNGVMDEAVLADAYWGYNGRSNYHTPDGTKDPERKHWSYSPYVSNDPLRGVQFRLKGTVPDANAPGGRRHIDTLDPRPGALILYRELIQRSAELA